jgi:hypothetical protein
MQELHNYLGLPSDTPGRDLLKYGSQPRIAPETQLAWLPFN